MGAAPASTSGAGVGKATGEPGRGVRLLPGAGLDGSEAHPVEREEAVCAAGARHPQVSPLEDGRISRQAYLLQLL